MTTIESLRDTHIGETACGYRGKLYAMPFHQYASHAYWNTVSALEAFENTPYLQSYYSLTVIEWFMATESMISFYAKMLSLKRAEIDFDHLKKQSIHTRFKSVVREFGINDETAYSKALARLKEFAEFRNEIAHDKYLHGQRGYKKTKFSPVASMLGISDVVEAMHISVDIFLCLSHLIDGLDLMPQVAINYNWIRADILSSDLNKVFIQICGKHNVQTDIQFECFGKQFPSTLFMHNEVKPMIKAKPTQAERYNSKATSLVKMQNSQYPCQSDSEKFSTPNFYSK